MTAPQEPPPSKSGCASILLIACATFTAAYFWLSYKGVEISFERPRSNFLLNLFVFLPYILVAVMLSCAVMEWQDRRRKMPPKPPMTDGAKRLVVDTIERVLRDKASPNELVDLMGQVGGYETGKRCDGLIHEAMHFVSDADIRARDPAFDAQQRGALRESLRQFIAT